MIPGILVPPSAAPQLVPQVNGMSPLGELVLTGGIQNRFPIRIIDRAKDLRRLNEFAHTALFHATAHEEGAALGPFQLARIESFADFPGTLEYGRPRRRVDRAIVDFRLACFHL